MDEVRSLIRQEFRMCQFYEKNVPIGRNNLRI